MDNSILFVNVINIESDSKVANGLDETSYVPEWGTIMMIIIDRTANARSLP
jgi:hypothetical protein